MAKPERRLNVALVVLIAVMVAFTGRAFVLQAWDAQAYAAEAAAKMKASNTLVAQRGQITDRNGQVLAATQPAVRVVADPLMISRNGVDSRITMTKKQKAKAEAAPGEIATILAKYLGGDAAEYKAQLTDLSRKHYVVIARQVPAWTYQKMRQEIADGGWLGIYKEDDPIRIYPAGDVASNVVGFMNAEGKGAGGLEYSLDAQLTGIDGKEVYDSSWNGRIPLGTNTLVPAQDGTSYTLTLDSEMQSMVNQALSAGVSRAGAKHGTAIVMNVKTGELLALSTTPGFDSNSPGTADAANLGNRAVSSPYEPGSVQKVITMAALADQGLVTPDTKVEIPSRLASGDGRIKDAYEHGTIHLTARGVVANSSNIGTVLLTRQMPKNQLRDYLLAFGLGSRTGIGLPGESAGWLPPTQMPDYSRDQIAFGQGLSVTAVQEAAAVAAIANGGLYNAPTLIKSATDGQGKPAAVPSTEPRRVISPEAAGQVMEMMESVITLKDARKLDNYRWAGKTGTAQRVDPTCSCYRGYTASFVGVAPAEDPQILVYVVIDQPTRGTDGSALALPVAQQIMNLALPRYGVVPSTTQPPKGKLTYEP
ncbi:peptidoglycan D,D-transpeptidase FtsI family protein [Aestuariimicrobium ganziense]|uniref:peptidoglycan D,D-transpeptidase FtsI family protein n=1 Tax=Aestuariimicrobium ganziense TaxID=2773677 RepID=UPI0038B37B52